MAPSHSSFWQTVTHRHSSGVRDRFVRQARQDRRDTLAWLTWALTALILVAFAALALGGAWTFVHALRPFHFWAVLLSGLTLGLVLLSLPRRAARPTTLSETQAPELYALSGEIAAALGLRTRPRIDLSPDMNASYGSSGWRRPVMTLGLPILAAFAPLERVAVMAHELAHGVSRDPARGRLLGLAYGFLGTLYWTLHPRRIWQDELGAVALPAAVGNLLLLALAGVPYGLLWLLGQLIGQDSQHAEYRADLLAAQVAGSLATASALDRLHLWHLYEHSLHKQRVSPERPDVFAEFRHQLAVYPAERMEALRQRLSAQQLSLDASHPPTAWRVQVVSAHPRPPQVTLDARRAALIEAELRPFVPVLQRQALEGHRERLGR